jgi:hypothetical protein
MKYLLIPALITLSIVPWFLIVRRHLSRISAFSAAIIIWLFSTLGFTMLAPVLKTTISSTLIIGAAVLGVSGTAIFFFLKSPIVIHGKSSYSKLIAASFGSIIWLSTHAILYFLFGRTAVAWSTGGDSANHILILRSFFDEGGVQIGPGENPVPMTHSLIATFGAFGRESLPSSGLLRHDLVAFSIAWLVVIALLSLLSGLLAIVVASSFKLSKNLTSISAAIGSVLPLSWFMSGYPIQYGFMNTHVVLVILLSTLLIFLSDKSHPGKSLSAVMAGATLTLASWSPLVLMPLTLGLALFIRNWRNILQSRGANFLVVGLGISQFAVYFIVVTIPILTSDLTGLSNAGGALQFHELLLPATVCATIVLSLFVSRSVYNLVFVSVLSVSAASLAALSYLLLQAQGWTYYPMKFAWTSSVLLMLYLPGLIFSAIQLFKPGFYRKLLSLAFISTLTLGYSVSPIRGPSIVETLLTLDSSAAKEEKFKKITLLADLDRPRVLWQSMDPNANEINFWLLQISANSLGVPGDSNTWMLRVAAYQIQSGRGDYPFLCEIIQRLGTQVEVITSNPDLPLSITSACPWVEYTLVIEESK